MPYTRSDLLNAEKQVREGAKRIAKYKLLIDQTKAAGFPSERLEAVLETMIFAQASFEEHMHEIGRVEGFVPTSRRR